MVNLVPIICRNCALNRSWSWTNVIRKFSSPNTCNTTQVGTSVRILFLSFNRSFMTYASLFRNDSEELENNKARNRTGPNKQAPRVSVIDPSGKETIMLFPEAEKLAKRNKMKLVQVPSSREDKVKYKLEKIFSESRKDKKDSKKIVLREETEPHDVETKINHMLKFMDKGLDVLCIIEGSGNKEKMERVLQVLEKSQLSNYLISKVLTKKSLKLLYAAKSTGQKDKPKGEDKESAEVLS